MADQATTKGERVIDWRKSRQGKGIGYSGGRGT